MPLETYTKPSAAAGSYEAHGPLEGIALELAAHDGALPGVLPREGVHAAKDGPHPGHELAVAHRLGQVVVRPQLEAQHAIDLRAPRGDDDDGDVPIGAPQEAADLEPVESRQHQVENDQVEALGPGGLERAAPVVLHAHAVTLILEVKARQPGQVGIVLDDEEATLGECSCACHPARGPGTRSDADGQGTVSVSLGRPIPSARPYLLAPRSQARKRHSRLSVEGSALLIGCS